MRSPLSKISTMRTVSRTSIGTGEAMRHAVEMAIDIDVIVDADATQPPFGKHLRFDRQRL
jgi:hypothetical protein